MLMRHIPLYLTTILLGCSPVLAQTTAFDYLNYASSAHVGALGGHNVSITNPDPLTTQSNPALLAFSPVRAVSLSYMNCFSDTHAASAQYCDTFGDRSAYSAWVKYFDWGTMKETTELNQDLGMFHAMDITLAGGYNYLLSDRWSGGVNFKFLYSRYGSYSSVALCVDLGINYWDKQNGLSIGLAFQNVGGQVKPFADRYEKLPINIVAGLSWKIEHAPLTLSLTLPYLNSWKSSDFYSMDNSGIRFGDILLRHVVIGADLNLTKNFYIALGYNHRIRAEMAGSKSLGGISVGTGLELERMNISVSYGQYQLSASSLMINFTFNL
ncbi:MAG: type IX secretion system protein PorQ [Bacteroidaceae bacterium]|nr:type IX secretion system protein PorQ [Bacteroidaceae bacterium]